MKKKSHIKFCVILLCLFSNIAGKIYAQDSVASPVILSLQYFLPENKIPYIAVNTKKKEGRKFEPVKNILVNVYFNEVAENNLLGKIITAENGNGKIAFPESFKKIWDSLNEFKFVAESVPAKGEEPLTADLAVKKAILVIDTSSEDGVRTVTAQLKEKSGNEWRAVKEIEMKLGIKRLLSNLSVGDAETYASDSSGTASAEFKRDSIPGDEKANIILVAKVEENDTYGNLSVEKIVPWGKSYKPESNFWHRSLWSTGNRAPAWLLLMAFIIIAGVWGTLIYLIWQTIKIKKLGKALQKNMTGH